MASMSISLPDKMREFIKSRVESGDYHNESEYIRDLIRRDTVQHEQDQALLYILKKSEESGKSNRKIPDIIKDVEARVEEDG